MLLRGRAVLTERVCWDQADGGVLPSGAARDASMQGLRRYPPTPRYPMSGTTIPHGTIRLRPAGRSMPHGGYRPTRPLGRARY
eukprot:942594-Rhodomonas_salina.2